MPNFAFSLHQKPPLLIINLSTLSYHFELKIKDLLCGYQLNKIKFELEDFLSQLKDAGCELEFVFKKVVSDDKDFLNRRLRDYKMGLEIIKAINREQSFEKLLKLFSKDECFPYNTMILVAIIQSAQKFGTVHGCNTLKGKPTVQQIELAKQKDAAWIMGLDTYYFVMPGKWKIWCDSKLNMCEMTIQELDPNIVMAHFQLTREQGPLFASLVGDLSSEISRVTNKVSQHFGKFVFEKAANFINHIRATSTDEIIQETVDKIFGTNADPSINEDFKRSLKSFEIDNNVVANVDMEILEMVKDDFMSVAEEILLNMPIFIFPAYLDVGKQDMMSINDLVLPIIQKTAGIILKSLDDSEPRKLVLLRDKSRGFIVEPVKICKPNFDLPPLKTIINGDMSTLEKTDMLHYVMGMKFQNYELAIIPEEYKVDCIILLYLLKNKSLRLIEARCILKTLVDARRAVTSEVSTEYPETINERAFRCSFLYSKLYFFVHSCLASLGMKNLCPEIQFDGVYYQKIYALNVQEENNNNHDGILDNETEDEIEDLDQAEIINDFSALIRM